MWWPDTSRTARLAAALVLAGLLGGCFQPLYGDRSAVGNGALGDKLAAAGVLTQQLAFYNKHGQLIWTEPRGKAAGYRWPQISISRGRLHEILLAAIHERLGANAVVTGHRLTGFEERGEKIIARYCDPNGKPAGESEGDLLIGADGIHSAVRRHFYPSEKAVFDGYLHYRGIVEAAPYLTGASMVVVGHRYHRAIMYPIAARPGGKGRIRWASGGIRRASRTASGCDLKDYDPRWIQAHTDQPRMPRQPWRQSPTRTQASAPRAAAHADPQAPDRRGRKEISPTGGVRARPRGQSARPGPGSGDGRRG